MPTLSSILIQHSLRLHTAKGRFWDANAMSTLYCSILLLILALTFIEKHLWNISLAAAHPLLLLPVIQHSSRLMNAPD